MLTLKLLLRRFIVLKINQIIHIKKHKDFCNDDQFSKHVQMYRGEKWCKETMKKHFNKQLEMTEEDEKNFKQADECYISRKKYYPTDVRVRDHCHTTGKYRGSPHQKCNINYKLTEKILVVFHNLHGYDSHLIMHKIGKFKMKNAIPNKMERYMSFMLGDHLVFIDSFQFMSSSLERVGSNLPKDAIIYTSKEFHKTEELKLMKQKGVYPYNYMDSFFRFKGTVLQHIK